MKKKLGRILALVVVIALLVYVCIGYYNTFFKEKQNPIVTMEIENYGTIKFELYPEYAPNTVANFVKLVENGYYNGKVFYGTDSSSLYLGRNAEGDVEEATLSKVNNSIEAGSEQDVAYEINGEFVINGFEANKLRHEKGVLSMCRLDYSQYMSGLAEEGYNSANAQVCIILEDESNFNGIYAGFGRVIEGMEIVDKISTLEKAVVESEDGETTSSIEAFTQYPVITKATVECFGVDYKVETHEPFDYYNYMYEHYSSYYGG